MYTMILNSPSNNTFCDDVKNKGCL